MPKVLEEEKVNAEFGAAWEDATGIWNTIEPTLELPDGFRDEYGIALLVFTYNFPQGNPIYLQLNNNLSRAGISRDHYMKEFHFKALHFYLTRALQLLKPDCTKKLVTYRGSSAIYTLSPLFPFGRFTSTSMDQQEAKRFGENSFFFIETCFGAEIKDFSFYPSENEILIPLAEKFKYVAKIESIYILKSTGQQCSYFNCAYRGGEKQNLAICQT
ncbi:hypothetical protein XELAEV_18016522mg, partial [Xenopus laevis]